MLKALTTLIKAAKDIGFPDWLANELVFILALLSALITLISYVVKFGNWLILKRKQRLLQKDLHPYFTPLEIDKATRFYIPTKYQDTAPSQGEEPGRLFIDSPKAKLIPMMLKTGFKRDDTRYYLILADSGMGKTTFMINLYLAYKRQWSFGGIKHNIELFPLGYPDILKEIEAVKNPEDTILLLDAFDEDTQALKNYKNRLEEILQKTRKFREIVITCRTQFFPSEIEEPYKTGMFKFGGDAGEFLFRKAYVSVFDDKDVKKYLHKRFNIFNPFNWKKLKKAYQIVKKSPNLVVRPMLLSHIEDLVNTDKNYDYAYQIYEVLIEQWIDREASKHGIVEGYESKENFKNLLYDFSKNLTINIYQNRKERGCLALPPNTKLSDTKLQIGDLYKSPNKSFQQSEWRTRSLLNRDAEGFYKFSHKSILEYFLANEAIENEEFSLDFDFYGMDATKSFFQEQVYCKLLRNALGTFTAKLKGGTSPFPLVQLPEDSIVPIKDLVIKNTKHFPVSYLIPLSEYLEDSLESISIINPNIPILYYLYDFWHQRDFPPKKHDLGLMEAIEISLNHDVFEKFQFFNLKALRSKFTRQSRVERDRLLYRLIIEQQKNQSKFAEILSINRPKAFEVFKEANEFLKKCSNVENHLKKIFFYY